MQLETTRRTITVIIPVYNVEEYLSQCIDSVRDQTYSLIEILLIDDGSTDNSPAICDRYAKMDSRIRVIHQSNKGIAAVRNNGVYEARGEYLLWVDSDDYIHPKMIETLLQNLIKSQADMSICNYIQGPERNHSFKSLSYTTKEFDGKYGLELIYRDAHYAFVMAASWGKLIRKDLYKELAYPNGKLFEDIYMSHHLIQRCRKIVYTDDVMYYYFKWPESILGKKLYPGKLDYLCAFEDRFFFFKDLGYDDLAEKARIQLLHSLMWEFSRAKDILHNKELVSKIVQTYREYYSFGTRNMQVQHETAWYMFCFFVNPWLVDFSGKVVAKLTFKR